MCFVRIYFLKLNQTNVDLLQQDRMHQLETLPLVAGCSPTHNSCSHSIILRTSSSLFVLIYIFFKNCASTVLAVLW